MSTTLRNTGAQIDGGVLPTSQEIQRTQQVKPAQEQLGNSLAKDIFGAMGETAKTTQAGLTASKNAAKRVAVDNLTEMSKELNWIEANRTPDMDNFDVMKANEAVYQFYGNRIFDNEDAQRSFDDMYHVQGAKSVNNRNTLLEKEQYQKDATNLFIAARDGAFIMVNEGVFLTPELHKTFVDSMTAGGYYTKLQAEDAINDAQIQGLQGQYETLKNMPIFLEDGTKWNIPEMQKIYNENFGATSKMDDKAQVYGVNGADPKTVDRQQNAFNALMGRLSSDTQGAFNLEIPKSMTTISNNNADISGQARGEAIIAAETALANLPEATTQANINKVKTWQTSIDIARVYYDNRVKQEESYAQYAVGKMGYDDLMYHLTKTEVVETKTDGLRMVVATSEEDARNFMQYQVDAVDSTIEKAMVIGDSKEALATQMIIAGNAKLTKDSGGKVKSKWLENQQVQGQKGIYGGNTLDETMSNVNKSIMYSEARNSDGLALLNSQNMGAVRGLYSSLTEKVNSGDITPEQANFRLQTAVYGLITSNNKIKTSTESAAKVRNFIADYDADGVESKGFWNFTVGEDVIYGDGSLTLITNDVVDDTFGSSNPDVIAERIASKTTLVRGVTTDMRAKEGEGGVVRAAKSVWEFIDMIPVPFAQDNTLVYTGGADVTSNGMSLAISQRLTDDLGEKYGDIDESTINMHQFKGKNGEPITMVTVRTGAGGKDFYSTVFTMDDFEKGSRDYASVKKEIVGANGSVKAPNKNPRGNKKSFNKPAKKEKLVIEDGETPSNLTNTPDEEVETTLAYDKASEVLLSNMGDDFLELNDMFSLSSNGQNFKSTLSAMMLNENNDFYPKEVNAAREILKNYKDGNHHLVAQNLIDMNFIEFGAVWQDLYPPEKVGSGVEDFPEPPKE